MFPEVDALGDKPLKIKISIIRSRMLRERDLDHRLYLARTLRALRKMARA